MPRVYTQKKSRRGKDVKCGRCGRVVMPGEDYFTWKFRYGGQHYRCDQHRPKMSELTQSKIGEIYSALETAQDDLGTIDRTDVSQDLSDIQSQVVQILQNVQDEVERVKSEYEEAAESFGQSGPNQEKAEELDMPYDELDSGIQEVEGISTEPDEELDHESEEYQAFWEGIVEELCDAADRVLNELSLP